MSQSYKLRAECIHDLLCLMKKLAIEKYTITSGHGPDVVMVFKTQATIATIKTIIRTIPDGHVMLETVALKKDYTGNRVEDQPDCITCFRHTSQGKIPRENHSYRWTGAMPCTGSYRCIFCGHEPKEEQR